MPTWKLANGRHADSYRAACLNYCIAHGIETNFMGFCPEDIFRVALLSSGSNIGRSSRLMSDVTGVLGSIPVTADASAWAAFAGTGGAHWEVLYQVPAAGMTDAVDFSPGTGEVAAYRLLDSAADVEVLDVTDDETFYSSIYESNVVRYGMSYATSVYFPFESAVFDPFSVENTNVAGDLVPAGAAGCWVTLIGAGANGTRGGVSAAAASGGDGGGGAKIGRSFIPVASLGSTYSLTRGTTPGSDTTFMSGGVNVTAGGGAGRAGGSVAVTLPGVSLTAVNGSNGGLGSSGGGGASNTGGAGSGGGGGCNKTSNVWAGGPGSGGSTTGGGSRGVGNGATGGTGGPGSGGGGAGGGTGSGSANTSFPGGPGGTYGGGGGGGAATNTSGAGGAGGAGAAGYSKVEWV
jgi:hypothetical protein